MLFKWFVENVSTFKHLQWMDVSLGYIIGYMVIYRVLFCLSGCIGCCRWSCKDLEGVWVCTLDGFGLPESNETACFQFQAVTVMICLSIPFWCRFAKLSGLSEQKDDLIGSPRALYEGVVQPLVFTIIIPSQRAWWDQLDNASTPGGSMGRFTIPEAD